MDAAAPQDLPIRVRVGIYGAAAFSFSMMHMVILVLPLWVALLEPSPLMIGIVLGSRQFLTLLFSIHGGALMDRFGTRRLMLFFAVIAVVIQPLFPAMPWVMALIALQMIGGLADTMEWMGAQTLTGQLTRGDPGFVGRMSFINRLGVFIGPPLVGWMWDVYGPWGAFLTMAGWAACGLGSILLLPAPRRPPPDTAPPRHRLVDLLPHPADYAASFRLMIIPSVAMVILLAVMRLAGAGIHSSFYVVYLKDIGISGTEIGLLFSVAGLSAALGALMLGRLSRMFGALGLLTVTAVLGIALVAITPLLGSYLLLMIASVLRGGVIGFGQALEIAVLGQSVDRHNQGKAVGLRTTTNRAAHSIVPIIMGAVIETIGVENSFYAMGAVEVALVVVIAVCFARSQARTGS